MAGDSGSATHSAKYSSQTKVSWPRALVGPWAPSVSLSRALRQEPQRTEPEDWPEGPQSALRAAMPWPFPGARGGRRSKLPTARRNMQVAAPFSMDCNSAAGLRAAVEGSFVSRPLDEPPDALSQTCPGEVVSASAQLRPGPSRQVAIIFVHNTRHH